jgi:hypothetical protein
MATDPAVRAYLARIGSKGGKKSRRTLTPEQSRAMLQRRAFRRACRRIDLIPDPLERARAFGIDLSLLEANLALSPKQRWTQHADALAFGLELQNAGKRSLSL